MKQVGTWFPKPAAYPNGFGPIGQAAQAAGLGFLLWIEPERAFEETQFDGGWLWRDDRRAAWVSTHHL